ncbi:F-box protein SKIP19-like [Aegilops tauschii subsp. strangulata]|uniref:F-box domain-containing protein n=3 Tax=Aegilops tauschii TaxID=37682 RepID=A0A453AH89_AEGTS|nr:putative F-box/LRR-repeat protein 23 [Aegilops tauschii subsp. strangulata]
MEEEEGESRDWAGMQSDALSTIFGKLDAADLLTGAGQVCHAWRRLADSDTTLWRRVEMTHDGDVLEAGAMACAAVDRAAGTMEAFWADTFVTDLLLRYIADRSFSLKSLKISFCDKVSDKGLAEAINLLPQLEELDISFCSLYGNFCELVDKSRSQLKCFRLNERWADFHKRFDATYERMEIDPEASWIANSMPRLQVLQLIGSEITNDGLMAILDHCPHLESLDIRMCYNLQIDDAMKSKCARIRNLKLPHDSISDFKYWAYVDSEDYSEDYSGSDFEVDMHDDLLDVVMDDDDADADGEFNYVDDYDDVGSESAMYDDVDDT